MWCHPHPRDKMDCQLLQWHLPIFAYAECMKHGLLHLIRALMVTLRQKTLLLGAKRSAFIAMCPMESKGGKTDIFESARCSAPQSWTPTFLIPPKHNN